MVPDGGDGVPASWCPRIGILLQDLNWTRQNREEEEKKKKKTSRSETVNSIVLKSFFECKYRRVGTEKHYLKLVLSPINPNCQENKK